MTLGGSLRDLVDDVLLELSSRRSRALMMVAAVGLSSGALLASVGISTAASQQIGSDIAASTLDLITVSVASSGRADAEVDSVGALPTIERVLPDDTEERLAGVDMVVHGGRRFDVSQTTSLTVTRLPNGSEPSTEGGATLPEVVAVTSGYLRAARTEGPSERLFHLDADRPVTFLGHDAARKLDVPVTDNPTGLQIWIDGAPYDVVGFLGADGPAALGNSVVIPYEVGTSMAGKDTDTIILVRTLPGAGARVANVLAAVIRPDAPHRLESSPVVSIDSLRRGVATQLDKLAAWTGVILMGLTILLIANSMVVAVIARTSEIGLRRALGFSRGQVAGVFLTEGALIGMLGGLLGAAVAAAVVVGTAAANGWTAVLAPQWIALGPLIGTAVGLIASAYPARRAATISPASAVRSE